MEELFINALNMSITASYLALAVFIVRLLLKKAPKAFIVFLWATVGIRLIFPFSIESVLSLIPSTQTVPTQILLSDTPAIQSGIPTVNSVINPIIEQTLTPDTTYSANPAQIISFIACIIWLTGIAAMLLYTVISFFRIHSQVKETIPLTENIFISDNISSPFILGILRPRIFLPSALQENDRQFVIAHEKAHLKRCDHLWKPLGFLLLSVYWFNPILWIAYIFLCKDIELACDEKVIKEMGTDIKKQYSATLINCSVSQKMLTACPLAFGETGIKSRIKAVLNYKKPAFWVIIVAVVTCIAVSVCFLTNPPEANNDNTDIISKNEVIRTGTSHPDVTLNIKNAEISKDETIIELEWVNKTSEIIGYGEAFSLEYFNGEEWEAINLKAESIAWPAIMLLAYPQGSDFINNRPTHKINVTECYNLDRYGTYRISTDFCYRNNSDEWFTAVIEFTIAENSFDITASRANWSEQYFPCLNSDKLYLSSVLHLPITKFETLDELQQFKNSYGDRFSVNGFLDPPSFENSTEHMDEEYFEKYTVFLVYISSGATNERFRVNSIYNDSQNFVIHIEQYNTEESGDSVMSGWFITVSVEKDKVKSCTSFDADLNAVKSTEEPTTSMPAEESFVPLDMAVSQAIFSNNSSVPLYNGECVTEGHIILGYEIKENIYTVYLIEEYSIFGFKNGYFINTSGHRTPAVMTFEKNSDGYTLIDTQYPKDGEKYNSSIRELFPAPYSDKAISPSDADYKNLWNQCVAYAKEYLTKIGREAEIFEYNQIHHTDLTAVGVSADTVNNIEKNELLSDYSSETGNYEIIENGVRYVYSTSYSATQNLIIYTKENYDTKELLERIEVDALTGEIKSLESYPAMNTVEQSYANTTKTFVAKTENVITIAMPNDLPEEITDPQVWNTRETLWIKIAEIENSDIALYANSEKSDKIFLRWNRQFFELNWDILDSIGLNIEMHLSDFDNDGKNELIVIPRQSYGTHFAEDDIHILEMNTYAVDEYILSAKSIKKFITDNLQIEDKKITFFESSVITDKADDENLADDIYVLQASVDEDITLLAYIDVYGGRKTLATLTAKVTYQNGTFTLNAFELNKRNG